MDCFQIQGVRTLLSPESGGYVLECRSVVLNHCNMSPKAAWSPINPLWHPPAWQQAQRALLILYCHAFILPTVSKVSMEIHSYMSKIAHNGPLTMTFFKQQTEPHCQSPSSVSNSQIPNIKPRISTMRSIWVWFDPPVCIFFPSVPFFPVSVGGVLWFPVPTPGVIMVPLLHAWGGSLSKICRATFP